MNLKQGVQSKSTGSSVGQEETFLTSYGGKVKLTGKSCTLPQCRAYPCSSGTPWGPWFSVDKGVNIITCLMIRDFQSHNHSCVKEKNIWKAAYVRTHQIVPRTYRHDLHQVLQTVKPMTERGVKWTSLWQSEQNERWGLCELTWGTERKDLISSSSADRLPSSTRTRLFSYSSCVAMKKRSHNERLFHS